jgi:electron transfer flavoprotein beta subunit
LLEQTLNIVVAMKQVPDTQKVKIDPERGTLIRKGVPAIMNPFDESALELALEIKENLGGKATVLTMGIPDSECMLRDALSLGADACVLLTDAGFAGADTLATSYALSRGIERLGDFELLIFGKQAIDGDTAQVGPEVAGYLGFPVITFVTNLLEIDQDHIVVERMLDNGKEVVRSRFPVLITVVKAAKRLRMPTIESILGSFERTIVKYGIGDIGAESERCGLKGSPTRVKKILTPKQHSRVRYLEGSTEEKARGFLEVIRERGLLL